MFQPQTYQEKRATINEVLLQQLAGALRMIAPAQLQGQLGMMLEQYGRNQQRLRDSEANNVLGKFEPAEGVEYASQGTILEYMKANLGRTYFGTTEPTGAPDGSIGTAGFGKKFNEWLESLPNFDASIGPDMKTGFYRDEMTHPQRKGLPILVLRHGDELTAVVFFQYLSVMTLNLPFVPADYNWSAANHYPLRGEMYTYRGNISKAHFEALFAAALSDQGVTAFHEPKLEVQSTGLAQVQSDETTAAPAPAADAPAGEVEAAPAE